MAEREQLEDKVLDVIEEGVTDPNLVTLSTGVVLRTNVVPWALIDDISDELEPTKPKAPMVPHPTKKNRKERNENDPDYLDRLETWNLEYVKAMRAAVVVEGTTVEEIPEKMAGHNDKAWLDKMNAMGRNPGKNKHKRYLLWMKYVAAPGMEDTMKIINAIPAGGVPESEVAAEADKFPGND